MIPTIEKNILANITKPTIICHPIAIDEKFNRGLAAQIAKKFIQIPIEFNSLVGVEYGDIIMTQAQINPEVFVVSMVTQTDEGRINSAATTIAFTKLYQAMNDSPDFVAKKIHFPYNFGCGKAGNWELISQIINHILTPQEPYYDMAFCKLQSKKKELKD